MAESGKTESGEPWRRFGGELPAGCDPLLPAPAAEPAGVLRFSHGRAVLAWLAERRGRFAAAAVCAYTCPSVPRHLRSLGLAVAGFDPGAPDLAALVEALPRPVLVLVPALFGLDPWLDAAALARRLGDGAMVVIDAAQTAFGHLRYPPPPGGAVFSCPRKTTALGDGACLVLDRMTGDDAASVDSLPEAGGPSGLKLAARRLLALRDIAREPEALDLIGRCERSWPPHPCRMTEEARRSLARLDPAAHAARRLANRRRLKARLDPVFPTALDGPGIPFCHTILAEDRDALLRRLHTLRVFATPLWPDAEHDPQRHPRAAAMAGRLLALPVDQRYGRAEMDLLADLVLSCRG